MMNITNEKIDLLPLIPEKLNSGYPVKKELFEKNSVEWIKLFTRHPRQKELKIKRYVNIIKFSKLLGQIQAEGAKTGRTVDFSNELIAEHKDFVDYLEEMGIKRRMLTFKLVDSSNSEFKILTELAKKFESEIGIYPKIERYFSKRGGLSFKSLYRNAILHQILINALNLFRKNLALNNIQFKEAGDAFLSKLLTGDGTLNVDKRDPVPRISIRIKDQNVEYLEDYKKILKVLGFKGVRIFYKHITVRAICSFNNLLYLYQIGAFKNTQNWYKLLVAIGLCLKGRRLKTKLRFMDLENRQPFTAKDISKMYNLHPNSKKWLRNMIRDGFVEIYDKSRTPYLYKFSKKALDVIEILKGWKGDLDKLIRIKKTDDLQELLELLKTKKSSK